MRGGPCATGRSLFSHAMVGPPAHAPQHRQDVREMLSPAPRPRRRTGEVENLADRSPGSAAGCDERRTYQQVLNVGHCLPLADLRVRAHVSAGEGAQTLTSAHPTVCESSPSSGATQPSENPRLPDRGRPAGTAPVRRELSRTLPRSGLQQWSHLRLRMQRRELATNRYPDLR